jgi:hypothetical protein
MQLPRFRDDAPDPDATTEYTGRVEEVEVLTDVTMELLPDETGHAPLAAKLASLAPVAIDARPSATPARIPPRRDPDASLEFPGPLRPELYADSTAELRLAAFDDDDTRATETRRPAPRWRLHAFAAVMIVCSALVGFAFAGRSRVTTVEETPAARKAPVIERKTIALPDPETVSAGSATATVTATATATATANATVSATVTAKPKEKIGLLVTPNWAKGRNVWVDGVIFGVSPKVEAACGKHVVKVGDKGKARTVLIPCGGKVVVAP